MTDADLKPSDDNQKLAQTHGIHYVITTCSKNCLDWIKIDRNDQTWKRNWQTTFTKSTDMPKE
jgi:hypothetical protein